MFNKIILVGRLGDNPLKKEFDNTTLCEINLVTEKGRGLSKKTEWHRVKAFGELAKTCFTYLTKGRMIVVIGEMTYHKVGERVYSEIVASEIQFL